MYSFEEFNKLKQKSFDTGYSELFNNIQERIEKGIPIASYEEEYYCQFLRLARDENGQKAIKSVFDIEECKNDNFKLAYGILWHDLHGIKKHYDYKGDEFSKSEVNKMLVLLNKNYEEWLAIIDNDRLSDEKLKIIRKETRIHLKALKKQSDFIIDGIFYESNFYKHIKKKIVLFSKLVYLKSKRVFEELGKDEIDLTIGGEIVKINFKSLVHITFGHYPGTTEGYLKNKSYFSKEIRPKNLIITIKEIFDKISSSLPKLEEDKIYVEYNSTQYAIWFKVISTQKKGVKGNIKQKIVDSFYPITQQYELDRIKNEYSEIIIDEKIKLYKKALNKVQNVHSR